MTDETFCKIKVLKLFKSWLISKEHLTIIEQTARDLFEKIDMQGDLKVESNEDDSTVVVSVEVGEPKIYIGEKGQTLFEIQHILKLFIRKKIQEPVYISLDINDYKKNKEEYLRDLAGDLGYFESFFWAGHSSCRLLRAQGGDEDDGGDDERTRDAVNGITCLHGNAASTDPECKINGVNAVTTIPAKCVPQRQPLVTLVVVRFQVRQQGCAGHFKQCGPRPDQNRQNHDVDERIVFIQLDEWVEQAIECNG